jgi:hypothetical protein
MTRTVTPAALLAAAVAIAAPPGSPKKPVTDTYHGVAVVDDDRWLEDGSSRDVQTWGEGQNAHARSVLDRRPGVAALRKRRTKIMAARTTSHFALAARGGQLFALRKQPPKEQPFLVVLAAADRPETPACCSTRTSWTGRGPPQSTDSCRRPTAGWSRSPSRRATARRATFTSSTPRRARRPAR